MIITIVVFILILSLLVFVHELGHFVVAKFLGIRVEEFGFGLPPRLWGKKFGETIYSLNWLPIGGFVKLAGEDETPHSTLHTPNAKLRHLFWARSKKERSAVLLAGVSMNFLLALGILSFVFSQGVGARIERVIPGAPAELAGIQSGDVIVAVGNLAILDRMDMVSRVYGNLGQSITLRIIHNGEQKEMAITPRLNPPPDQGALGIAFDTSFAGIYYPWYEIPFRSLIWAIGFSLEALRSIAGLLWKLISFRSIDTTAIAGPIGIAQVTGQVIGLGFMKVLQFTGILSLNLAVMNILPIPALDGGRLLFVVLEKLIGKKVKPRAEALTHQIGMVVLLVLLFLVTVNDVLRIVKG